MHGLITWFTNILFWKPNSKALCVFSPNQIVGQRLADQIPLVIHYYMLQESASQLQSEMLQMLQDREKAEILLQEDPGIAREREQLQQRLKRLKKARLSLLEFRMESFNFHLMQL